MRILFLLLMLAITFGDVAQAFARGGTSADDCTSGSTDPDCRIFAATIEHAHFDTDSLVMHVGSTIIFSNKDKMDHNIQITNQDGAVKDLGLQAPGTEASTKLGTPGKYVVKCGITPQSTMTIDVK